MKRSHDCSAECSKNHLPKQETRCLTRNFRRLDFDHCRYV